MTVVFALPPVRPEVEHLFAAEEASRMVRRGLIAREATIATETAAKVLDHAIAQLVAARSLITNAASAASSKDV